MFHILVIDMTVEIATFFLFLYSALMLTVLHYYTAIQSKPIITYMCVVPNLLHEILQTVAALHHIFYLPISVKLTSHTSLLFFEFCELNFFEIISIF